MRPWAWPPLAPPDQVDPGGDVAPLVGAADLELAPERLVEVPEVVGLQEHVAELGEGDAVLALHPGPHRLLGQHRVDGDVLAHVAEELEDPDRLGPVAVVDQAGLGRPVGEVEQALELGLDGGQVVRRASRGRAGCAPRSDRPGSPIMPVAPAGEGDRPVAGVLEPPQQQQRHQVADVQAVGGGVEPGVERDRTLGQARPQGVRVGASRARRPRASRSSRMSSRLTVRHSPRSPTTPSSPIGPMSTGGRSARGPQ